MDRGGGGREPAALPYGGTVRDGTVTLALSGDVMLGRGVDQILPHPGDPRLEEGYVADARTYVDLAEAANGPIPLPVEVTWPWGDALRALDEAAHAVRIINLETAVTRCDAFTPGKTVHYRMHPDNLSCLAAARPDVCALANNHTLDFGRAGLAETLDALKGVGLRWTGAGRNAAEARRPAAVPVAGGGRVLVFSFGMTCSGIPPGWAATGDRSGLDLVPELTAAAAAEVATRARIARRPGDIVVASIHWGSNWGYEVERDHRRFAHGLIDAGVDVVHGHSSHHPRPIEVYRGKVVFYGCGDLVNDYEGIRGYGEFRDDLRLLYFVTVNATTALLTGLRIVPLRAERMRLRYAATEDAAWLRGVLNRICSGLGARFDLDNRGDLHLSRPTG